MIRILLILLIFISHTACVKQYQYHGFDLQEDMIDQIIPNVSTRQTVISLLGEPTSRSHFGNNNLYYIENKTQKVAFLDSRVIEQKVLEINLNSDDVVTGMRCYDVQDMQELLHNQDQVILRGKTMSPITQMLGNLGKYNASSHKRK